MFRRLIRKLASNGQKTDLGVADALEAQQKVFDHAKQVEAEEAAFDEKAARVEELTNIVRRDSGVTKRKE